MKKFTALAAVFAMLLTLSTCTRAREDPSDAAECLEAMVVAVSQGDEAAGLAAESERARVIEATGSGETIVSYAELSLLARFIAALAGDCWRSEALRMCVGEVALNRVASTDFPDTLEEVCRDCGLTQEAFEALRPPRSSVVAALKLLQGERLLDPDVLYITRDERGEIYATFYSRLNGYTYFLTGQ